MLLNIHIALVGQNPKPILEGFHLYRAIDKLYLLHSTETRKIANDIQMKIKQISDIEIFLEKIDPFSMESVVYVILEIGKKEVNQNIFVNMTGGTNIMAGSACAASYFLGAQAYYVLDKRKTVSIKSQQSLLIELPIPKIPSYTSLEPMQRIMLKTISKKESCDSSFLKEQTKISPQNLSYHIKTLKKKNLIEVDRNQTDPRKLIIRLTNAGKLLSKWV